MTHVCVRSMMRRTAARTGVRRRSARGPGRPDDATRDGAGTAAARRVSGHPARAAEPQALQLHTLPGFTCTTIDHAIDRSYT